MMFCFAYFHTMNRGLSRNTVYPPKFTDKLPAPCKNRIILCGFQRQKMSEEGSELY